MVKIKFRLIGVWTVFEIGITCIHVQCHEPKKEKCSANFKCISERTIFFIEYLLTYFTLNIKHNMMPCNY